MSEYFSRQQVRDFTTEFNALDEAFTEFLATHNPRASVLLNLCINTAAGCVCDLVEYDEHGFEHVKQKALEHFTSTIDNFRKDDETDPVQIRLDGKRIR